MLSVNFDYLLVANVSFSIAPSLEKSPVTRHRLTHALNCLFTFFHVIF